MSHLPTILNGALTKPHCVSALFTEPCHATDPGFLFVSWIVSDKNAPQRLWLHMHKDRVKKPKGRMGILT